MQITIDLLKGRVRHPDRVRLLRLAHLLDHVRLLRLAHLLDHVRLLDRVRDLPITILRNGFRWDLVLKDLIADSTVH